MILTNLVFGAIFVLLVGGLVFSAVVVLRSYLRFRGQRLITCPETHRPAAVHVDGGKVLATTLIGNQQVRLDQCSRWPEKRNCGQDCLSQVNADPEQCLVWNIVAQWYKGKSCAYCQKPFGQIHWHDRHPALLSPERIAKQWNEIPPEQLPGVFATHLPVCWNCYIAENFRRRNLDGVLDRPWKRVVGGEYVPKDTAEAESQKRPSIH